MSPRKKPPAKDDDAAKDERDRAQELAAEIRGLLEAFNLTSGSALVFRKVPGKREQYLDSVGIDELARDPYEPIKGRWGGGDFHIVLRDSSGDYVKGGSFHIAIAGAAAPEPQAPDRFAELERKWEERIANAKDASSPELVRFMFDTMREQLREMRNPPAGAATTNPLELTVSLLEVIQRANEPLLTELMKRHEEKPRGRLEELREMLELMTLFREIGGGGGAPPASGLDRVIDKLADPLAAFFQRAAPTTEGPPRLPTSTAPEPMAPPRPSSSNGAAARPPWYALLERGLPQLLAWARDGKDPELRADVIVEDLPDHYLGPVHEQLARGAPFLEEFLAHVPEARPHGEWFRAFFARVLADLEAMFQDADQETNGAADAPSSSVDTEATA
ncbi:MAG: hypothetical protein AB7N73_14955 [Gemmatimonadales bacterium]